MGVGENAIADREIYLTRMQRSILDKMFFIDKVFEPFDTVLDFGCANGELIKALMRMCPEYSYAGYDIDPEMIAAAEKNVPQVPFWYDWDSISVRPESTLINISSTIHEVYSYGTDEDVRVFLDRVFGSGFKYISVRDMAFEERLERPVDEDMLGAVRRSGYTSQLADFEQVWGRITTQKQLVHFLLKYKYTQNWEREVRENYFPVSDEQLVGMVPQDYSIVYCERFTLPFTAWQIRRDFGFELKDRTHIKLILEKRGS